MLIKQLLGFFCRKGVWTMVVLVLVGSIAFGINYGVSNELAYGILFSIIIIGAAKEKRGGIFLNNRILHFAGQVSYGSYCYNWITLVIALLIINQFGTLGSQPLGHVLHYIVGFAITFGVAALSFHWLEQPFLKLKDRKFHSGRTQIASKQVLEFEPIS